MNNNNETINETINETNNKKKGRPVKTQPEERNQKKPKKVYTKIDKDLKYHYNSVYYNKHKTEFLEKYKTMKELKNKAILNAILILNETDLKQIIYEINSKHSNILINTNTFKNIYKNSLDLITNKITELPELEPIPEN